MSVIGGSQRALSEPTVFPGVGWVAWLALVNVGVMTAFFGPIQVLLAQQVEQVGAPDKRTALAIVLGAGALASTVFNPLWGALSDRTTLAVGRRIPWVVGGAVVSIGSFLVLSGAGSVLTMAVGWCLVQTSVNAVFAAITAAVPDQVPVAQRASVGGVVAICQILGVIVGSGIAAVTGDLTAGYLAIAAFLVLAVVPYAVRRRDLAVTAEQLAAVARARAERARQPRDAQLRSDYWWAFVTRFLMQFGNALMLLFLFYYVKEALDLTSPEAADVVFVLTAVYGVTTLVTAIGGGVLSDRMGRRKVFVIGSGLVVAAALALMSLVHTLAGAVTGAVVLGLGFGMYQAVDFALITEVLPEAEDRGRDLGILNIASALPQVAAPLFAIGVGWLVGPSYSALYLAAAAVSALGSVLVVRIRSVP